MENTMAAEDTQIAGNHYVTKNVQPWQAMEAWMTRDQFAGFLRGNAIKYLARCDEKGGVEDIKKARHYMDKLIEFLECSKDRKEDNEKISRSVAIGCIDWL
jgi:hypothetical protein